MLGMMYLGYGSNLDPQDWSKFCGDRDADPADLRPITPVPNVPEVILGVITIRGEVVEVVDLRQRMRLSPIEPDRRTRIVVVHGQDGRVAGCMVDRVCEVLRVPEDSIQPAAEADLENVSGLCKREDRFVSLLDLDQVLDIERTD